MQIRRLELLSSVIFLASLISQAHAANFTFSFGDATQCDDFPISWSGGSPPFSLQLTPLFGTPRTVQIPSSSFSNGRGSFQTQLPFNISSSFIATLSDASGFGTGGTSSVLKVGKPVGNINCNVTDPGVDFFFELNTALQQCRPYTFSGYDKAVQPITITGVVPGGTSFFLNPPTGPTSYDWLADAAAGTSIIFIMTDSQGRKGGSSDQKLVGVSDDSSCLSSQSPSSVSIVPSATASNPTTTSSGADHSGSSSPSGDTASHGVSGAVIAGAIVAAVIGILAIGLIVWFFCTRRRRQSYSSYDRRSRVNPIDLGQEPANHPDEVSHLPAVSPYPFSSVGSQAGPESQYSASQYQSEIPYMSNPYSDHGRTASIGEGSAAHTPSVVSAARGPASASQHDTSMSSAARRKAQQAGIAEYKPQRFILHTDLEEAGPSDQNEEIIELPPQYSEGRAPLRNAAPSEVGSSSVYSATTVTSPRAVPSSPPPPLSPPPRSNQPYR